MSSPQTERLGPLRSHCGSGQLLFSSLAPDELPFAEDCSFGSAAPGMIDAAAEAIALAVRRTTPGFLGAALRFAVFLPACFFVAVFFVAVFFVAVFLAGRRAVV